MARSLLPPGDEHPHLVLCGVSSEQRLRLILHRLQRLRIDCRPFHEADLDGELTAIATAPVRGDCRRHFRRYQCLRE